MYAMRLAADMIPRHVCANNVEANAMHGHNPKKILAYTG